MVVWIMWLVFGKYTNVFLFPPSVCLSVCLPVHRPYGVTALCSFKFSALFSWCFQIFHSNLIHTFLLIRDNCELLSTSFWVSPFFFILYTCFSHVTFSYIFHWNIWDPGEDTYSNHYNQTLVYLFELSEVMLWCYVMQSQFSQLYWNS